MARGQETGNHPNRKAENWRPTTAITGPMGQVVAHSGAGSDLYHAVWQGPGGYSASVEHMRAAPQPSPYVAEQTNYVAGPFRTVERARVGSEALGRRAEAGKADRYRTSSYDLTAADLR